jgi:superfamily II DNA/RNA helicase
LSHAREQKWLDDPIDIVVGERSMLSSTVKHTYVVVDHEVDKLGVLCRCVLADQKLQNIDSQPNRGIVYVKEPENARALAEPLRNILWGKHAISVLLPDGSEPIQALHAFRDNKTSLLIASSYSSRGLDLPAVTHVYSTFLPKDESEYLHMTGRMGRIGSSNGGVITTLLLRNQLEQYKKMLNSLGGPQPTEIIPPMPRTISDISDSVDEETIEEAKRSLETILALSPDEDK